MTLLLVVACAAVGLAVGSFLAVVVDRVPHRQPVGPPWRRPAAPRRRRDVAVVAGTATLFGLAAARFGPDWALPAFLVFFAVLVAVTVIDAEHFLVPNRILLPSVALSVPLLAAAALLGGEWSRFGGAVVGALVGFNALLVIHLVHPRGMGAGDVKLAGLLGLFLGWLGLGHVVLGLFLGFSLGAAVGLALVLLRIRRRQDHVPFAPFLAAGAVLAVLVGAPLLRWYTGL